MKLNQKIILHNGVVVTENEVLDNHSIIIKDKKISQIIPSCDVVLSNENEKIIDCSGMYILPGLIDIHSDTIEKVLVPRKGVKFDTEFAIFEVDKQLAKQGITTIFHSISIAETSICNNNRTLKTDDMFHLCDLIFDLGRDLLIKHRFHARFELNTISAYDHIVNKIQSKKIHELSFMDHTPGQGQYRDYRMFEKVINQQYGKTTYSQRQEIITKCRNKPKLDLSRIESLIHIANEFKIPLAYHDVETEDQVDWMLSNNFTICEFPLSNHVAKHAMRHGLYCVVGAPNVILGHSHYNNVSATELLQNNMANVLCSDYFSATLLLSLLKLHRVYNLDLVESVRFATLYPAQALGISDEIGSIRVDKCADLIVVDVSRNIPRVSMTLVNGNIISSIGNYC